MKANRNKGLSRCENIKLPSTLTGAFFIPRYYFLKNVGTLKKVLKLKG